MSKHTLDTQDMAKLLWLMYRCCMLWGKTFCCFAELNCSLYLNFSDFGRKLFSNPGNFFTLTLDTFFKISDCNVLNI